MATGNKIKKRKTAEKMGNRFAIVTVTLVVCALAVVLNTKVSSLKEKQETYALQEEKLLAQLESEEARAEELEEERIYVQTKQYIEEIARSKLGLVNPGEIIIKPEE